MRQAKVTQGKKKKAQHFPEHPGNAWTCVILRVPGLVAPTPSEEHRALHSLGPPEPVVLWDSAVPHCRDTAGPGAPPDTSAHGRAAGQPEGRSAPHSPTDPRPWRRLRWQETTWALDHHDCCLCHLQHPKPSASVTEAQLWHRCGKKACQKNVCYCCILYL